MPISHMFVLSCLLSGTIIQNNALTKNLRPVPEVIKLFFRPNTTKHETYHAHKCQNANNCWHFNIYKHDKISIINTTCESLKARKVFIF